MILRFVGLSTRLSSCGAARHLKLSMHLRCTASCSRLPSSQSLLRACDPLDTLDQLVRGPASVQESACLADAYLRTFGYFRWERGLASPKTAGRTADVLVRRRHLSLAYDGHVIYALATSSLKEARADLPVAISRSCIPVSTTPGRTATKVMLSSSAATVRQSEFRAALAGNTSIS